jgi:hypothetical protein
MEIVIIKVNNSSHIPFYNIHSLHLHLATALTTAVLLTQPAIGHHVDTSRSDVMIKGLQR